MINSLRSRFTMGKQMAEKKPSRILRILRFVLFWILAIALIIVNGGFSSSTIQSVSRYINEQSETNQRNSAYVRTAAAVSSTLTTNTPQPTDTATATNTFTPTPLPTSTNAPSATPTITPSFTFTLTPTVTASLTLTPSATPTTEPKVVAQAFETNTPRAIDVTIPALNTA